MAAIGQLLHAGSLPHQVARPNYVSVTMPWKEPKEVYGIPYCRMHIRRLELKGLFPQRVQVGDCRVAWLAHEVEQWIQGRVFMSKLTEASNA